MRAWKVALISSAATLVVAGAVLAAFLVGRDTRGSQGSASQQAATTQSASLRARVLAKQGCEATRGVKFSDADVERSFATARADTVEAARLDPIWDTLQGAVAAWDNALAVQRLSGKIWDYGDAQVTLRVVTTECEKAGAG